MTFTKAALRTIALLALATPLAVTAQPAPKPAAKPAPRPTSPPPAALPPAWTVTADATLGTAEIGATTKSGNAQAIMSCKKGDSGLTGMFTGYRGAGLRTDGGIEAVAVYARGADWQDAFALRLRYSPGNRTWEFARPLSPVFLASFSRGATLVVVNGKNQEVMSFDLTGSTAAVRALRTTCGLPS